MVVEVALGVNCKVYAALLFLVLFLVSVSIGVCYAQQYWINETVQVPAGGSTYWSGTLYAGNRLTGTFTVGSGGDIKFVILDAANYAKYSGGQTYIARYVNQAVQVPQVDFSVPNDGTWFVLLDNSYSAWNSKIVTVTLTASSNSYSTTNDNPSTISTNTWLILALIVVVIVIVIARVVSGRQKKKNYSANPPPPN